MTFYRFAETMLSALYRHAYISQLNLPSSQVLCYTHSTPLNPETYVDLRTR